MFSIIIPTLNNLKYLKFCLNILKKNSKLNNEIFTHGKIIRPELPKIRKN